MKLFLSLALFAAFLLCPTACADGVREGLSFSRSCSLPALFPFSSSADCLSAVIPRGCRRCWRSRLPRLYGLPPEAAPALVLGLIGGYPGRPPRPHVRCSPRVCFPAKRQSA